MTERIQRCSGKVAVSPSRHRIIIEIRQLGIIGVESHRQFPAWIEVAEQHVGDRCASFLARIPGLQDRTAGSGFVRQGYGATGEIDQDDLLPGLCKCGYELLLDSRKFYGCPVPTGKTRDRDRHLLAFKGRRDTACEYHYVAVFEFLYHGVDVGSG